MTAMLARALRALADRLSPRKPIVIHSPHIPPIDGEAIKRAVIEAANRQWGR